jgi:chromosomal replication initiation ATPase DnaA
MTLTVEIGNRAPRGLPSGRSAEQACRFVAAIVAAVFEVPPAALRGASRGSAAVCFARHAAMYLAHVHLGLSQAAVGACFGRDRTSVAHASARVEDSRDQPRLAHLFTSLEVAIEAWERDHALRGNGA